MLARFPVYGDSHVAHRDDRDEARVLLLPAAIRLLGDTQLAHQVCHRHAQLGLLERGHDLLYRILLAFHRQRPARIG